MGLLEDLSQPDLLDSKFNKRCGACRMFDALSADEAAKVKELMSNPNVAKSKLTRVLQANGYDIKQGVLNRHARGECAG